MTRTILLTGASGFLGFHLAEQLGNDRPLCPRHRDLDLLDYTATAAFLNDHSVTHVIHGAAFAGGVALNRDHPGRMATENLRMGLNVLEAAATVRAHVSIVSTVCVYPEHAPLPTRETSIYDGYPAPDTACYGLAKRALLSCADGLAREGRLTYSYLIPTNLYGPRDHFEDEAKSHVVPALIRRALRAAKARLPELVVWGDGSATRDLLYVEDAARAVVASLERGHGQPLNLGSGREIAIRELVELVAELTGYEGRIVWDATKPTGAQRRALDATLARELLDFRPEVSLRDGLQRTIEWCKKASID